MKKLFSKENLKAIGFTIILCFLAVFAFEVIFIAEVVGAEYAVTFLLFYYKQLYFELREKWVRFKYELGSRLVVISQLLLFQPRVYGVTASASCLFLILAGSTFFACVIWIPALVMSSGFV